MFTRGEFEIACKSLAENATIDNPQLKGWTWREHPEYGGLGYLERSSTTTCRSQSTETEEFLEELCEEDAATLDTPSTNFIRIWQSIAYNVSFQMPVFYLSVYTNEGTPFSLPHIVDRTSLLLFRPRRDDGDGGDFEVSKYAIQVPGATMPLVSQGEHPTLGTPCYYLHPCETQGALAELVEADGRTKDDKKAGENTRKLELWLLLVGNAVDLRV
ncbi:hypothetical protein SCHPADRAFT_823431 [Schizopora paradoxa]|uniref:Ubiquitin-like-conjugating enzyme ATG10 n=1 Tax=Schizopora paradoxa TaxID=27342 RepID=A0A0H2S3L3_9AGAM|nr:hypothetical protein SCHPADRAFT_823431 [Schizopora paradoxa]